MRELFDDFYDDTIFNFFGKPRDIKFNTGKTQDMNPAFWIDTKEGYKAICRTVGVDENDVKVSLTKDYIELKGETEYDSMVHNFSYKLPISHNIVNNIDRLEYKTVNGLTYIYIYLIKPEKKSIEIKKIK